MPGKVRRAGTPALGRSGPIRRSQATTPNASPQPCLTGLRFDSSSQTARQRAQHTRTPRRNLADGAPLLAEVVRVPQCPRRGWDDHHLLTEIGQIRRSVNVVIANRGSGIVRRPASLLVSLIRRRALPPLRLIAHRPIGHRGEGRHRRELMTRGRAHRRMRWLPSGM